MNTVFPFGGRHAFRSEWPFSISIIITGLAWDWEPGVWVHVPSLLVGLILLIYNSNTALLFAFVVGGLGFEFCVFVAGWRHALRNEWPFIIIIINSANNL